MNRFDCALGGTAGKMSLSASNQTGITEAGGRPGKRVAIHAASDRACVIKRSMRA